MLDDDREFIAYDGEEFTIEWYFDQKGSSQALHYFEGLSNDRKRGVLKLFQLMGDVGQIWNTSKFRYEGDKIYAFKPMPDRFLCFFYVGKRVVVTNAFEKKANKMPKEQKARAMRLKQDYEERIARGGYYEEEPVHI